MAAIEFSGHRVMARIEHIGDATLYLGDCREVLPTLGRVDAVVTSPPYNTLQHDAKPSGMHKSSNFIRKMNDAYRDDRPEAEYQDWLRCIISQCLAISDGLVWVNHKIRYRDGIGLHPARFLPFPIYSEIIWNRDGAFAFNARRFAPNHETVFGFGKPHYWDDSLNTRRTVWSIPSVKGQEHPCPFPVDLVTPLILTSVPNGGIALDPFMGSGTTGVACARLERRFIGIEIDPRYFDIACKRIDEAQRQGRLFDPPRQRPVQEVLL